MSDESRASLQYLNMLESSIGLHIKEECPPYQEISGDSEASFGNENSTTKTKIEQEGKGTWNVKNEINQINETKVKVKKEITSIEDSKKNIGIHHLPVVIIERNFELEQALKVELEREKQDENLKQFTSKCEKLRSTDIFQNQMPKKQIDNSHCLSMVVCLLCNKCFRGKIGLENHICIKKTLGMGELMNNTGLDKDCPINMGVIPLSKNTRCKKKFFRCEVCSAQFKGRRLLSLHRKNHRFACGQCEKSFCNKVRLNLHLVTHSSERPFSCEHCSRTFKRKAEVTNHISHFHGGKMKRFKCDECSKSFAYKQTLIPHKRKDHSDLRPYSCNDCGDTFKDRKCLKIHTLIHTGLKPYSCSFCDKKFAQTPHLKRHELVHTGVKPYLCKTCGKSFRDSSNFKVHLNVHLGLRPFKCDKCGKGFTQSSHVKSHIRAVHSEERPYVCDVCGDSFKEKNILTSHMFLHSDVKPFNCEACGKDFAQGTAFYRHKCRKHLNNH